MFLLLDRNPSISIMFWSLMIFFLILLAVLPHNLLVSRCVKDVKAQLQKIFLNIPVKTYGRFIGFWS